MPAATSSGKPFYHHIDLMRFLFSILIVYYHLLHANMIPYVSNPRYETLANLNNYSSNVVVCFFMIAGVFLYQSFRSKPDRPIFDYIADRVVRLWPLMIAAILLEALIFRRINWNQTLVNAFFLQCSGISLEYKGLLWYVSSFFFASIFLYAILRTFKLRSALFLVSLITYFSCVFLINRFEGRIGGRETVFNILNIGTLRGVAFIGVGILIGVVHERLGEMMQTVPLSSANRKILFIIKIVAEFFCCRFLYRYFLESRSPGNHIVLVLAFAILLMCLLSRNDPIGLLLNRKYLGFCGKYAYSIYVMQGVGFLLLQKTLWLRESFVALPALALIASTLFILILGIAGYYLVERPCANLYRKWYRKYRSSQNGCSC